MTLHLALLGPDATPDEVDEFVAALTGDEPRYNPNQPRRPDGRWGRGSDFASVGEAAEYGYEEWGPWRQGLSSDERYAFDAYRDDPDAINGPLRSGRSPEGWAADLPTAMDGALARSRLPEDLMLYRGITPESLPDSPERLVGRSFTDNGYPSTSLSRDIAANYAWGGGVMVEIRAPAGSPGGFIDRPKKEQAESLAPQEAEVLLPRGSRFKVTGYREGVLEVEYQP